MRKNHSAMLKFKVAVAALTGRPITEICKQYEIGEGLVHKWKKRLKEKGTEIFNSKQKNRKEEQEVETAKLYQRIGQLTTEVEFLKKIVEA
jgi:transposase